MICSICDGHKQAVKKRNSRLIESMSFYSCDTCTKAKKEPRYIVVLAGRTYGIEKVADHLKRKLYDGSDIAAADLVS